MAIVLVEVFLKIFEREFVAILELAIVITLLLDSIIRQVDVLVVQIARVVLFAGCADVTVVVVVTLLDTIDGGPEAVSANVEFASLDQKWALDVLLYDKSREVTQ